MALQPSYSASAPEARPSTSRRLPGAGPSVSEHNRLHETDVAVKDQGLGGTGLLPQKVANSG